MNNLTYFVAFSAGILSFFSPCVLPLIPSYITFLVGDYTKYQSKDEVMTNQTPILLPAFIFIISFSLVFILLGISASFLGQILIRNQSLIRKISGLIIILLGFHLIGIIKFKWLNYEKGLNLNQSTNKYIRPVIMGIGLSLAWTPCIGPILSSILLVASNVQSVLRGGVLLLTYSLGFSIPFIIVAISINWTLPRLKKINKYLPVINKVAGILIILIGILIFTDQLALLKL